MQKLPVMRSKVNYFNVMQGDLCFVIEDCGIFKKVIKVGLGMGQVHYLYNFEMEEVDATEKNILDYQKQRILPIIIILSVSKTSISYNRMFNDIMLELDGKEPKPPHKYRTRPDLAPDSLIREIIKLVGGTGIEDDIVDELLDGKLYNFCRKVFVHMFYKNNYEEIRQMAANWKMYKPFVSKMREDTIKLEKELLESMNDTSNL